jgi:hypothetical protein
VGRGWAAELNGGATVAIRYKAARHVTVLLKFAREHASTHLLRHVMDLLDGISQVLFH